MDKNLKLFLYFAAPWLVSVLAAAVLAYFENRAAMAVCLCVGNGLLLLGVGIVVVRSLRELEQESPANQPCQNKPNQLDPPR